MTVLPTVKQTSVQSTGNQVLTEPINSCPYFTGTGTAQRMFGLEFPLLEKFHQKKKRKWSKETLLLLED
jgi:hypothetical protein